MSTVLFFYISAKFIIEPIPIAMPPMYYLFDYIPLKDEQKAMECPSIKDYATDLVSLLSSKFCLFYVCDINGSYYVVSFHSGVCK